MEGPFTSATQSEVHPLLAEDEHDVLTEPITFVEACQKVGWFYDRWHRNPKEAIGCFQPLSKSASHPLRRLFLPPEHKTDETTSEREDEPTSEEEPQYTVGDAVKAYRADRNEHYRLGYDYDRKFFPGKVVQVNADGTYQVTWDDQSDVTTTMKVEELVPMQKPGEPTNGVDFMLANMTLQAQLGLKCTLLLLLAAGSIALPHVYCVTMMKDECTDVGREEASEAWQCTLTTVVNFKGFSEALECFSSGANWSCEVYVFLKQKGGLVLGVFDFALSLFMFIALPLLFRSMKKVCPVVAKQLRRFLWTNAMDPICLIMLPNLVGFAEICVIMCYLSSMFSFAVIALMTQTVGVFAFGSLIAGQMLKVGNALLGERAGITLIRERRCLETADKIRKSAQIQLKQEELVRHLTRFLHHPHKYDTLVIDLHLLAILALGLKVPDPDSIRIRYFVVEKAYGVYSDPPKDVPSCVARRDVVVDVFEERCFVPGLNLEHERWHDQGQKFPWQLTIAQEKAKKHEEDLNLKLGLPLGSGCFTFRPEGGGGWAGNEAMYPEEYFELATQAANRQERLNDALYQLSWQPNFKDKVEVARALLDAGAQVNHTPPHQGGFTPLHNACGCGFRETAKLLIQKGADVNAKDSEEGTAFDFGEKRGHRELVAELRAFEEEHKEAEKAEFLRRVRAAQIYLSD